MKPDTTEKAHSSTDEQSLPFWECMTDDEATIDRKLAKLSHAQVMSLPAPLRLRWFHLAQIKHPELNRIANLLSELLPPVNDTRIITLIGPTGIGKTTLARTLAATAVKGAFGAPGAGELATVFVKAPANGDKSTNWTAFYKDILEKGKEPGLDEKREIVIKGDKLSISPRGGLGALRSALEKMLGHRKVRLLIIDEALHLLRGANYNSVMDTVKSLGDASSAKLLLLGDYTLVETATQYGQVSRRNAILHYRRYMCKKDSKGSSEQVAQASQDRQRFIAAISKFQSIWPSKNVPNFSAIEEELISVSLGSVGMLKSFMTKFAQLQLATEDEKWDASMFGRAAMAEQQLKQISDEILAGESAIKGHCYGESLFSKAEMLKKLEAMAAYG